MRLRHPSHVIPYFFQFTGIASVYFNKSAIETDDPFGSFKKHLALFSDFIKTSFEYLAGEIIDDIFCIYKSRIHRVAPCAGMRCSVGAILLSQCSTLHAPCSKPTPQGGNLREPMARRHGVTIRPNIQSPERAPQASNFHDDHQKVHK